MTSPSPPLNPARRRTVIWIAVLAFTAGLVAIVLLGGPTAGDVQAPPTPPLQVRTLTAVRYTSFEYERRFVGRVEAARESSIGFELGGLLTEIRTDEGDRVARGQILAGLDTERLRSRRTELGATLAETTVHRDLAESTRARVQSARDRNAVSAQRMDEANQQFQANQAAVQRVESALAVLDVDLAKAILRAPYDAIVARRFVDEGEVLSAGQAVLTLLERRHPEARIGVARSMVDLIERDASYTVEVAGRPYAAKVKAVLPLRDEQTRSVDVIFALEADLDDVHRGDLATVTIQRRKDEPGFWLPLAALTESSRGLWSCLVAVPVDREIDVPGTHELSRRELMILHQEEDRVFVRGTLREGEQVVREGLHRLAPQLIVEIEEGS